VGGRNVGRGDGNRVGRRVSEGVGRLDGELGLRVGRLVGRFGLRVGCLVGRFGLRDGLLVGRDVGFAVLPHSASWIG